MAIVQTKNPMPSQAPEVRAHNFNELYRKRFPGIKSKNQDTQKKRVVGVDGTNNNHQCDLNELLGYGKAKEDSKKPIYGTMTYVDELTGLTLFAQLYPEGSDNLIFG